MMNCPNPSDLRDKNEGQDGQVQQDELHEPRAVEISRLQATFCLICEIAFSIVSLCKRVHRSRTLHMAGSGSTKE